MRHQRARDKALAADQRIGRYVIQGEIATGGMATVHCGRLLGPAGFARDVAIKRLHPQYAKNPDFVNMFLDEARLASRVLHPNVVPILDVVADGGELFLVMEFVAGESLSKLVRNTPEGVPLSLASAIAVGMLEGLHAAHEARGERGEVLAIVHRDVSPQNVLVGMDGVARLIDFGVAKASGNATMTRDGQIKGKVAYMAPEQIAALPVDRRADIYSASVVLWEMLTGRRFFGEVESDAALVLKAMSAVAAPPSSVRPEVPAELDALVLHGLSRDRDGRFATAREMAQALEKVAPPAAARDVARWVEAKAGAALRMRVQQLSHFDLSVATELPGKPSIPIGVAGPVDGAGSAASARPEEVSAVTVSAVAALPKMKAAPEAALSRGSDAGSAPLVAGALTAPAAGTTSAEAGAAGSPRSAPGSALPPAAQVGASRKGGILVAGSIVVALLVGYFAARWFEPPRPTDGPSGLQPGKTEAPVATAPASGVAATPSPAPSGAGTSAPLPTATSPETAPSHAASHGVGVAPPTPARPTTVRTAAPTPKPNCNPSYVITADGVRQYKPECLK